MAQAMHTHAELAASARALVPKLRERAPRAEELRRIPDDTLADLHASGLFRMLQPKRVGGSELAYEAIVELTAIIGRGCGSTAWVLANLANHHWMLALWPRQAQDEIWGPSPDTLIGSALMFPAGHAERTEGGYRLSGHWKFSSGIDACGWCMLGGIAHSSEGELPEYQVFLVPQSDYRIIDTWHVAGLAATGSRDVRITNAYVPDHRTALMNDLRDGGGPGTAVNAAPVYRLPLIAINPYPILAPLLGMAEAAFELYYNHASSRRNQGTATPLMANQAVQLRLSQAAAEIDAAWAMVRQDCRDAQATVERGESLSVEQRLRIRRNHGFVTQLLVAAVDRLFTATGGRGIYLDHDMQRVFRDVHAAAVHIGLSWEITGTMWGQHKFGLPVTSQAY